MFDLNSDDSILWDLWLSRYHLAAVAAGDKLGIFACIKNGASEIQQVAKELALDIKGIEAITCLFASMGLLNKACDKLALTDTSENYLIPESPLYWAPAFVRIYDSVEYKRIYIAFRGGKAGLSNGSKSLTTMWEQGNIDLDAAVEFTKIMYCTIFPASLQAVQKGILSGIKHLLDVGGGSGCFAGAYVKKYKNVKATIFELSTVCEAAKPYLKQLEVLNFVTLYPGNFFVDPLPQGADGILFSNIFHDWPYEQALFLAEKAYTALPPGGKIFLHEMLLNKDKNGPLTAATFNLLMYINHGSQQFTKAELHFLLRNAGFSNPKTIKTHSHYSVTVAEKMF